MTNYLELFGYFVAFYVGIILLKNVYEHYRCSRNARQHSCKPSSRYPNIDPLFGTDLFVSIRKADFYGHRSQFYNKLHEHYGRTFEMKALSETQLQTAQPENIQAIAATQFNDFGVGPIRGNIGAPFLDRGVFTEDGEYWKSSRALIRPTFSRAEIADLDSFERHVGRFLDLIPRDFSTVDLQPLAKRLFLDTSTEFLFGESLDSLLPETPFDTTEFMKAFDYSLLGLAIRLIAGPLKFLVLLDPAWKKAYKKVHAFVDKHVTAALNNQRALLKNPKNATDETSTGGKYILLHQMALQTQDPYDLRAQILNVFFPARDTAAIAFGNVMFELARHPHVWADLRTEVSNIPAHEKLTFELLKSLKITKSIINETLRLHLPASRIARVALRDTVLPVGGGPDARSPLFVPKGRVVEMNLYTIQRDPEVWGSDADEFKPERWRGEGRPLWEANWQYEPFLGGLRMCPAQNQVLTQVSYLLVRMAQEFRGLESRDEVGEYVEDIKMTVESRNGVRVALLPA
ncbi:MAG: hypothetical protein Q9166_001528 [cf. Caloplaca sp. 2 TL-2023]